MPAHPRTERDLREHMFGTYFSLRLGLAVIAFLFPILLYAVGKWRYGLDLAPSMSAYFFAADSSMCTTFPMRTIFVGLLCAISFGLYLYKGFEPLENRLLNAAAVAGVVVAVVPEALDKSQLGACPGLSDVMAAQQGQFPWHYTAAVLMFFCLAVVAWKCACKTLDLLPAAHQAKKAKFRKTYRLIAIGMVAFPIVGIVVNYFFQANSRVFFIEMAGIWTFAAYWFVKSREMFLSKAELHALQGEVTPGPGGGGSAAAVPAVPVSQKV